MILGMDIGTHGLKVNGELHLKSLVTTNENILGSDKVIEFDGKKYVIGEGRFDSELNKSIKESFLPLLFTGIALSTNDVFNKVVVGLPIDQYKKNKGVLEDLLLENSNKKIIFNGKPRSIVITDFAVYPEGIGAYYSLGTEDNLIIVDIGGRTTDIAYIDNGKVKKNATVSVGTLNIYNEIAEKLNNDYCLNLDVTAVERIIERGYLNVDNESVDLSFITVLLKDNFLKIKEDLDLKFPARTEDIMLVGGGSKMFGKAFTNRYKNCRVAPNYLFANSIGFRKVGEAKWQTRT